MNPRPSAFKSEHSFRTVFNIATMAMITITASGNEDLKAFYGYRSFIFGKDVAKTDLVVLRFLNVHLPRPADPWRL